MNLQNLLNSFKCKCGKKHSCDIEYIFIKENAMECLQELCLEYSNILIVADENTYKAAGSQTEKYINQKVSERVIFSGSKIVVPNEDAINAITQRIVSRNGTKSEIELIIGIGSGCIQDLCKYVSFQNNLPYYIVATAPSMDGYASSGAAMITKGMKVTYSAKVPKAIIADTDVLSNAPLDMIKAGYGDIVGKYSALNDWKLSKIVNNEYFCQYIYDLTYDMLKETVPLAGKLLQRDRESVKILMEALIGVGIAMSYAGNSRPASGSEHHLSHFFEITGIIHNKPYLSHGVDVIYSTVLTAKLREKLINAVFPEKRFMLNLSEYKNKMRSIYGDVADGCIALQNKIKSYDTDRIQTYKKYENQLKTILKEAPNSNIIESLLNEIELPTELFYKTYSEEQLNNAISFAKDLKDRYTVLWMYYDIFGLEKI